MDEQDLKIARDTKFEKDENVLLPSESKFSHIKNKIVRQQMVSKYKRQKRKSRKEERELKRKSGAPKGIPHTIESLRVPDETTVGNLEDDDNEEIRLELQNDEFSSYYQNTYAPKVLITYSDNPLKKTRIFGRELTRIIPNSLARYRNRSGVKKIVASAIKEEYTDVVIINENRKEPDGLLVIHLPNGPTAHFKLSNVKITTELRKNHKEITTHRPEVILNNFGTRLGLSIGRMLGALFHYEPEFKGRRVVTFHNQRDYIFFRHHRYEFTQEGKRTRLRELGPRFTLKLRSLQQGTFDSKFGDFEWIISGKRHQMETSRRKFFL